MNKFINTITIYHIIIILMLLCYITKYYDYIKIEFNIITNLYRNDIDLILNINNNDWYNYIITKVNSTFEIKLNEKNNIINSLWSERLLTRINSTSNISSLLIRNRYTLYNNMLSYIGNDKNFDNFLIDDFVLYYCIIFENKSKYDENKLIKELEILNIIESKLNKLTDYDIFSKLYISFNKKDNISICDAYYVIDQIKVLISINDEKTVRILKYDSMIHEFFSKYVKYISCENLILFNKIRLYILRKLLKKENDIIE